MHEKFPRRQRMLGKQGFITQEQNLRRKSAVARPRAGDLNRAGIELRLDQGAQEDDWKKAHDRRAGRSVTISTTY